MKREIEAVQARLPGRSFTDVGEARRWFANRLANRLAELALAADAPTPVTWHVTEDMWRQAIAERDRYQLERNAARERLETLCRLVIRDESPGALSLSHDCMQWLRQQSGYGTPAEPATEPRAPDASLLSRLEEVERYIASRCQHEVNGMPCGAARARGYNGCETHRTGPRDS